MGYFAQRAAPFGVVPAEVVMATFYNFAESRVRRALPDAWTFAPPEIALDARLTGSVAALRRTLGDTDVSAVSELARRSAESAPLAGRALFAANASLPWPDDPIGDLWHAATLLREHRGDGHVAVLTAEGLASRDVNVLHFSASAPPDAARQMASTSRDYDEAEWGARLNALVGRGLMRADGQLTEEGRELKQEIEGRTDRLALTAYDVLDDDEMDALIEGLDPLARAVLAAGGLPPYTPIGAIGDLD